MKEKVQLRIPRDLLRRFEAICTHQSRTKSQQVEYWIRQDGKLDDAPEKPS